MRNTRRKKSGFTIVEMLMALTITALLLTALAASINASMVNVTANEESYKAINNARQALSRMCTELRTAQGVEYDSPKDSCKFLNADGDEIRYKLWDVFDIDFLGLKKDTLYLIKDSSKYVLCENVEDMVFTTALDPEDPNNVRNVQMSITVRVGNVSKKLSTATVIMRNMP